MARIEHQIKDKDIDVWSVSDHVDLESIVVRMVAVIFFAVGLFILSTVYLRGCAERKLNLLLLNRVYGSVTYKSLRVSLVLDEIEIQGLEFTPAKSKDKIGIQRLLIYDTGRENLFRLSQRQLRLPDSFKIAIVGLQMPGSMLAPSTAKWFHEVGIDRLNLSIASRFRLNRQTTRLEIDKTTIDVNDLGRIVGSVTVDGFEFPKGEAAFDGIFDISNLFESPTWQATFLKQADFQFQSSKLIDRLQARAEALGEGGPFSWLGVEQRDIASESFDFKTMAAKNLAKIFKGQHFHLRIEPPVEIPVSELHRSMFLDVNRNQKLLGLSLMQE